MTQGPPPAGPTRSAPTALQLWTVPNLITVARLGVAPVVMAAIAGAEGSPELALPLLWVTLIGLIIGEVTDIADGQIARRYGSVSEVGKLLDPMADSLFRMLVFLAFLHVGWMPLWMVAVLFVRDILVAYLRIFSALQQVVLSARLSGKVKAVSQGTCQIGIVVFLMAGGWRGGPVEGAFLEGSLLFFGLQATAITAWSLVDYARDVAGRARIQAAP
jgi:CDP-diacylglycerol--glycerol-3-phosphate 3-phosphatidyltransferase